MYFHFLRCLFFVCISHSFRNCTRYKDVPKESFCYQYMQNWYVFKNIRNIRKKEKLLKVYSDFISNSQSWYNHKSFNTLIKKALEYYLTALTGKLIIIQQLINNDKQFLEVLSFLLFRTTCLRKYL